jgi:hypothetical protein
MKQLLAAPDVALAPSLGIFRRCCKFGMRAHGARRALAGHDGE